MPVYHKDVEAAEKAKEETVTVRVTKRGHGQISTGGFDGTHGAEFFAEGEEFQVARSIAEELADEDGERRFVTIVTTPAAKAKA